MLAMVALRHVIERTVARCARHMLSEHLLDTPEHFCVTRGGQRTRCNLQNRGLSLGVILIISDQPSSWTSFSGTHVCLCWKPQ